MNTPEVISHEQAIELLPWLVNDSLNASEHTSVLEHASSCVICRRELAELERLRDSIADASDLAAIPAPDMRRINARIDALIDRESRGQMLMLRLREFLGSPWRVAFAAQTALVIVLGAALVWPEADTPEFTTLTTSDNLPAGQYIRVVFDPNLAAADLTRLLEDSRLTVVAGPSVRGVYTLGIVDSGSAADVDAVVSRLLGEPGVVFAQPVARGPER